MGDFDSQMEALTNQLERHAEREAERAEARTRSAPPLVSAEERARLGAIAERRRTLELTRANVVEQIEAATSERFKEHLARALEALDAQIAAIDAGDA